MNRRQMILGMLAVALSAMSCDKQAPAPAENAARLTNEGDVEPSIKSDFSTPEGAILRLEDAYRARDIDAAVACKDFRTEARVMLQKSLKLPKDQIDDELVSKTAEVLELGFRKEFEREGFPDMKGVRSTFPSTEPYEDGIVVVTEVCYYLDGGTSRQKILVAKTSKGWRVLNPLK